MNFHTSNTSTAIKCSSTAIRGPVTLDENADMDISDKTRAREATALKRLFEGKKVKISQAAFGALYQIGTQGMVWQYLNNERPLNKDVAVKFAQGLGISVRDFSPRLAKQIERLHKGADNTPGSITGDNFTIATHFPPIPVISWVQAGMMKDIDHIPDPDHGEWELEYPTVRMGPRSWVLEVEGDSMDDGTERSIPAGHRIFCDPDKAYTPNCLVIAKNINMQRATFKQLITEDGKWFLKAWNIHSGFGVNGRLEIDDPDLRVIAVVTRSRAPDRVY